MARQTLTERVDCLEEGIATHEDNYKDLSVKVDRIHDFLLGATYDQQMNGGFIKFIKEMSNDVSALKKRREWMKGAWWVAGGIVGVLTTILIFNWDKIF